MEAQAANGGKVPVAGREGGKVPVARGKGGKIPVARREGGKRAATATCLGAEQAAAHKDQGKRDSNNQYFSHFYLLKIFIVVKCRA